MDPDLASNTGVAGLGVMLLLAGVIAWLWVGRRRFRRRNSAGIEEFGSYSKMLVTRFFERLLRIGAAGLVLLAFMVMARAVNNNMSSLASSRSSKQVSEGRVEPRQPGHVDKRSILQPKPNR
jgi:hypothetical protein